MIVSGLLLVRFGRRMTRELTSFLLAVRTLADERLPLVVSRLRNGERVDIAAEAPPLALRASTREVTEIAEAFSAVQRTAVEAAVGEAELRSASSGVFRSLARRSQSLLQRQLGLLDSMERGTDDPEALEQLFSLDHLTTRMRRHAEGLIVLSGASPGRRWREPVPLVEVLRGATGEIEDYARVDLDAQTQDRVAGGAVADVTHLLAELIENAANYSPPGTQVRVVAYRAAQRPRRRDRGPRHRHPRRTRSPSSTTGWPTRPSSTWSTPISLACSWSAGWPTGSRSGSRCGCPPTAGRPPSCCCPTRSSFRAMTRPSGRAPNRRRAACSDPRTAGQPSSCRRPRQGDARSPDQARALITSIRQGWRNGSAADPNPDSDTDGAQA